jgi:hypothetical protein
MWSNNSAAGKLISWFQLAGETNSHHLVTFSNAKCKTGQPELGSSCLGGGFAGTL